MGAKKITKRDVDALRPTARDVFLWDAECRGFGVKVTPAGRKIFVFQYRLGGRGAPTKRINIATYGDLTVDQARDIAQEHKGVLAKGDDPAEARRARRAEAAAPPRRFQAVLERYKSTDADYLALKPGTRRMRDQLFDRLVLPTWGDRPIEKLRAADVHDLLDHQVALGQLSMRNNVATALRQFFRWAKSRELVEVNPVADIPTLSRPSRDRVLTDDELKLFFLGCDRLDAPWGAALKMLALTLQRRTEVLGLEENELDVEGRAIVGVGPAWHIPATRTKNGRAHLVALVPAVLALLQNTARRSKRFTFSVTGRTALSGFSEAKRKLDGHMRDIATELDMAPPQPWTFHDLRRTATTRLAELGVDPHVVDKLLNHVSGTITGVAAVYNRAEYLPQRRRALELWADHVNHIVTGEPRKMADVVQLQLRA